MGKDLHDLLKDPVHRAAYLWLASATPRPVGSLRDDLLPDAVRRVTDIFAGRVPWEQATAQDREVWFCRPSDPSLMDGQHGWDQVWDTLVFGPGEEKFKHRYGCEHAGIGAHSYYPWTTRCGGYVRMFGDQNIGNVYLSNLYYPWTTRCPSETLRVRRIWASASRGTKLDEYAKLELVIGDTHVGQWKVNDVIEGVALDSQILPHQSFFCSLLWSKMCSPMYLRVHMDGGIQANPR